jgi:hypothetical protein
VWSAITDHITGDGISAFWKIFTNPVALPNVTSFCAHFRCNWVPEGEAETMFGFPLPEFARVGSIELPICRWDQLTPNHWKLNIEEGSVLYDIVVCRQGISASRPSDFALTAPASSSCVLVRTDAEHDEFDGQSDVAQRLEEPPSVEPPGYPGEYCATGYPGGAGRGACRWT